MASSSNSDAAAPAAVMPTGCAAMSRAEFNTYTLYRALRSPGFSADWCAEFIRRCGPRNFTFYLGKEHGYVSLAESLVLDRSVEGYAEEYEPFRSLSEEAAGVLRVLATLPSYSPNPHPEVQMYDSASALDVALDMNAYRDDVGVQRFVTVLLEAPPGAQIFWGHISRILRKRKRERNVTEKMVLACELARRRFLLYRILQLPKSNRRYRLKGQPELAAPWMDQDLAKCIARQLTL